MTTTSVSRTPRLSTAWWGILIRALVGIALLQVANTARVPFHAALEGRLTGDAETLATAGIFVLTPALIVAFIWAWMRWVERRPISVLRAFDLKAAGAGLLGGFGLALCAAALAWADAWSTGLALDEIPVDSLTGPSGDIASVSIGAVLVFLVTRSFILQGIPEELIFRGWLWDTMRTRPWVAFVWTTIAFTLPHLVSSGGQQSVAEHGVYLAIPLGMSVLGGAVVLRFGNFWWSAGTHGGLHMSIGLLSALFPVEFGPRLWVALGTAQILIGIVVALSARRRHIRATKSGHNLNGK